MDFDIVTNNLKKAFDVWKDNLVAYLVGMLIVVIAGAIIGSVGFMFGGAAIIAAAAAGSFAGIGMALIAMLVASILAVLITVPLTYGTFYMAIKGARGEKVEISDVFYAFKSVSAFIRALIFGIVFAVLCAIFSIIPLVGTLIFLVLFTYACYIYIMTPSEGLGYAFKESFNIAKENIVETIVVILVFAVLLIIGSLLFGIGQLITGPIAMIFVAYALKELKPEIRDAS